MPRWVLTCNNCWKVFTHADIGDTLENLFVPEKPKFPPGGLEQECPSCNAKAIYQQHELRKTQGGRTDAEERKVLLKK